MRLCFATVSYISGPSRYMYIVYIRALRRFNNRFQSRNVWLLACVVLVHYLHAICNKSTCHIVMCSIHYYYHHTYASKFHQNYTSSFQVLYMSKLSAAFQPQRYVYVTQTFIREIIACLTMNKKKKNADAVVQAAHTQIIMLPLSYVFLIYSQTDHGLSKHLCAYVGHTGATVAPYFHYFHLFTSFFLLFYVVFLHAHGNVPRRNMH